MIEIPLDTKPDDTRQSGLVIELQCRASGTRRRFREGNRHHVDFRIVTNAAAY
ncbi:hypothetical protein JNUCC64_25680 [Streptomyces sp. JNUCC 64]